MEEEEGAAAAATATESWARPLLLSDPDADIDERVDMPLPRRG